MSGRTISAALDHTVVLVEDLDAAAARFETAGFTVTPTALHNPEMGTANRCIMLPATYIELLTIVRPTERNAGWRELLVGGPGIKGLALRSDDIEGTAERLAAGGVPAGPPLNFSRQVEGGTLRFSVVRLGPAVSPGLQIFACLHHTPDLVWTPPFTTHRNGARKLAGLMVPCSDPASTAAAVEAIDARGGGPTPIAFAREGVAGRIAIAAGRGAEFDLKETCGLVLELIPA